MSRFEEIADRYNNGRARSFPLKNTWLCIIVTRERKHLTVRGGSELTSSLWTVSKDYTASYLMEPLAHYCRSAPSPVYRKADYQYQTSKQGTHRFAPIIEPINQWWLDTTFFCMQRTTNSNRRVLHQPSRCVEGELPEPVSQKSLCLLAGTLGPLVT